MHNERDRALRPDSRIPMLPPQMSRSRAQRLAWAGATALALGACATESPRSAGSPPSRDHVTTPARGEGARTGGETGGPAALGSPRTLPAGAGRAILERDCTGCHGLDGLWAYQGYYNEQRWRSMIVTMVDHGAELDEDEIAMLTSYLVEHFGPGTR